MCLLSLSLPSLTPLSPLRHRVATWLHVSASNRENQVFEDRKQEDWKQEKRRKVCVEGISRGRNLVQFTRKERVLIQFESTSNQNSV